MDATPRPQSTRAPQGTHDRRQSVRITHASKVRLSADVQQFAGDSENLSPTDVKFHTDEGMQVTVEIEEDGIVKRVPGHVVRLESTPEHGTCWVVEFD